MITVRHLSKQFFHQTVLNNISLDIKAGEIFGMIGKSGAGKSTLLRCLNLLERPTQGEVIINGQSLLSLTESQLRHARYQMGMIFQQFNLLETKTVFDNIALPLRIQKKPSAMIDSKVRELLNLVELSDKKTAYPKALSGGQKQRVAIARALACDPKILLSDEATSALDPATTHSILTLLEKINKTYGITIVLITHEMEVIKHICHRVGVLEQGALKEVIALNELFSHPNSMAKALLYQHLSPKLPACFKKNEGTTFLKLYFDGHPASTPFISQVSRTLGLDINILSANIDQVQSVACGIMIISMQARSETVETFIEACRTQYITVEVLS